MLEDIVQREMDFGIALVLLARDAHFVLTTDWLMRSRPFDNDAVGDAPPNRLLSRSMAATASLVAGTACMPQEST
jgi:hypothetical protein